MREFVTTFKFRASVLFAIISLLIVMIAGLLKDVRFGTIALRSLLAFFVTGGASYFLIFILEAKGIIDFDAVEDEMEIEEIQEEMQEKAKEETGEESNESEGDTKEETSEGESGGFKPLNADNLQRIAS